MRIETIQKLADLGFEKYRSVDKSVDDGFTLQTGLILPEAYFEFLNYCQPPASLFLYRFMPDGQEFEGCVNEFSNIHPNGDALHDLVEQIIFVGDKGEVALLPIGSDPGGNYIYLRFSSDGATVIDVDYGTGRATQIAPDFESFVNLLQPDPDL